MRAAIYTRISLDRRGQRAGVDRQEADCRAICDQRGWTVADVYCDNDTSAYNGTDRPAYDRLVADVAEGLVDVVVAWHQDRLWRSVIEHQLFLDTAARAGLTAVVTPTATFDPTDADDGFVSTVLAAVAKHQSASTARRMARRQLDKATKGEHHGGRRAFGHTTSRDDIVPEEAALIREAAEKILAGIPQHRIVHDWRARGVRTSMGREWTADALTQLLRQPRLAGLRVHHGEIVAEATWPAILDRVTWERLQALFRSRRRGPRAAPNAHLLSGVVVCWRCGARLTGNDWDTKPRYVCRSKLNRGCAGVAVNLHQADAAVTEMVLARIASPAYARALASRAGEGDTTLTADLVARIDRYRARLADLDEQWLEADLSTVELAQLRREARNRLADAEHQLERITRTTPTALLPAPDALTAAWPALTLDERRAVIAAVVDHVVVGPARHPRNVFRPERLTPVWAL